MAKKILELQIEEDYLNLQEDYEVHKVLYEVSKKLLEITKIVERLFEVSQINWTSKMYEIDRDVLLALYLVVLGEQILLITNKVKVLIINLVKI